MLKNPVVSLIIGLILLGGGWLWQLIYADYYASQDYYKSLVEESIEETLSEVEYQMIPILDSVSTVDILEFDDYSLGLDYPYFVYRNGELKIWADYHYTPKFEQVAGEESLRILSTDNRIYLARKWFSESQAGQFEVVAIIPLKIDYSVQNSYLKNTLNEEIFKSQDIIISSSPLENGTSISIRGKTMFWLANQHDFSLTNSPFKLGLFILYTAGFLFVLLSISILTIRLQKKFGNWIVPLAIFIIWFGIKGVLTFFSFPESLLSIAMFDSRFFAVSWFERSFGALLLNTIAIFLIAVSVFKYYRKVDFKATETKAVKIAIASLNFFILHLIINYQYLQLRTIYFNSQLSVDISKSFHFDSFKILTLLVFILVAVATALFFHVVFKRIEARLNSFKFRFIALIIGSLFFALFSLLVNLPPANLIILTIVICIILFATGIHRSLQQASLSLTLYVLFWIVIEAGIAGWCVAEFEKTRDTNQMLRYAQNLASKNDYMAEFMIHEAINKVNNDPSISARLSNPFLSKDYILNKISKGYLNKYLDKYTTSIYLYSHSGEGLPGYGTTQNYHEIYRRYSLLNNVTEYNDLFILSHDIRSLSKHYMAFVPVKRYKNIIGYIIVDFQQKRLVPENVYPELLVDNRFRDYQSSEFSYAIFEDNYLIHSAGDMDYSLLNLGKVGDQNLWVQNNFRHYKMADSKGDVVVVSKPYNYIWQLISNSAFFIALLLFPIIIVLGLVLIRNLSAGREISYTAKIQLFLNLAFFLPLVVVTITTMSFITSSFRNELIEGKISESSRLTSQIEKETDAFIVDVNAKDLLTDKIVQLANYGHFDATVFGTDGLMITTTQPDIFNASLQSTYLNPIAFQRIIEHEELNVVLDEAIGVLDYYTIYAAIRSRETNRLLGVLAIPFFRAETTIEANQIEAFTTILNVFVAIFLVALIATFQTSKWLTAPLLLIRERLGKTSFSGGNTPIEWNSEDEIGKLITEYNNMLLKLESSREALTRSQKESAWREVAQQVAHEIKNPITPMKLTLQKMELAMNRKDAGSTEQIEVAVKNLLNQLQMLNDIVTSFSEFAKMPIPKNTRMDIAEVLEDLKSFFDNEVNFNLELHLHADEVYISADKKLMTRILTNIILNAGQSRKAGQDVVNVTIATSSLAETNAVRISIRDNGTGIDKEVVDRVFIPRFSTKKEGSGIGLAVAKHGVEQAGGTIWFETSWGEGTTFYLQLPEID